MRLWRELGAGIHRWQQDVDLGQAGQDSAAFVPSWSFDFTAKKGKNTVMVNATNKLGSQTSELICNPAGTMTCDAKHTLNT